MKMTNTRTPLNNETNPNNDSDNENDSDENGINNINEPSILFSCRCESARPVFTLLSCLRSVSVSNAGFLQEAITSSTSTSAVNNNISLGGGRKTSRNKIQYATVFVSDTSMTFQVHGIGKQSRATVDIQAGLFSEYYVAEQHVPIDEDDEDTNHNSGGGNRMEIIKGGEFGINLSTLLECLSILGPNSLDRTTICLSYDLQDAIFKIELLEQSNGLGGLSSIPTATENNGGGVIISNCAIPGMAVADDDDDSNIDAYLTLDHAFRSHPVLARARIKSDFLKDAVAELTDVSGSTAASIGISKVGLEFTSYGHSTECHVVVPYIGNHPEIFVSLEGVGGGSSSGENVVHERNYPLHSVLSAMRGLDIASETCITINANGMVAIQHQVLDTVGNGDPNYVDFIMCCLEGDYDDEEEQQHLEYQNGLTTDNSGISMSATQQSNMSFIVPDDEDTGIKNIHDGGGTCIPQSLSSQGLSYEESCDDIKNNNSIESNNVNNNKNNNEHIKSHSSQQHHQQITSLFGTVAEISAASENTKNNSSSSRSLSFNRRRNKGQLQMKNNSINNYDNGVIGIDNHDDDDSDSVIYSYHKNTPKKRKAIMHDQQQSQNESTTGTQSAAEESEFEEEEEQSLDVTAAVASTSFRLRSTRGGIEEDEEPSSSPQLMYGDTQLEASGDEDGI